MSCNEPNIQQTVNAYNEPLLTDMLSNEEVLTDAERLEQSMGEPISNKMNCKLTL